MADELATLEAESQWTLIQFLRAELEIGYTFVQSARLARGEGHDDHFVQATGNARKAAETVKRFLSDVKNAEARAELLGQEVKLDRLISRL